MDPVGLRAGGSQVIPRPQIWSPVDTPPPAASPLELSAAEVALAVAASDRGQPPVPASAATGRSSAVLVVIADDADGRAGVLLTRRSELLRNHPGQISFPGGRLDPGETFEQAALREAWEEVALDPASVTVVGSLDPLVIPVSNSAVVPIVAHVATQAALAPASMEVERVLWVPLADLVRPDTFHVERWAQPPNSRLLYFFELDDETVWGATAFMLCDLLRRLAPTPV